MDGKNNKTTGEYLKTKVLTRPAIRDGKIEESYNLLMRAENIVMEMCNSLRDEISPETCANMRSLYIFCYEKLVSANMKRDIVSLDEALKILRHMRETWVMVMDKLKQEKASQQPDQPDRSKSSAVKPAGPTTSAHDQPVGSTICLEG